MVYLPLFTYIYHKFEANVGKYTIPIDSMGTSFPPPRLKRDPHGVSWGFQWVNSIAPSGGLRVCPIWAPVSLNATNWKRCEFNWQRWVVFL